MIRYAGPDASVSIDVGAMPNAAMLSGYVFHDADHTDSTSAGERPLEGWTVELLRDNQPIRSMLTDVDGFYAFSNVVPNYASGVMYSIRFSAPGATATTAMMGTTDSDFTDGLQRIDDIEVQEGQQLARTEHCRSIRMASFTIRSQERRCPVRSSRL